jgi:RNA polymerase sigma-70 factor, ECF subfamily
LPQHGSSLAGIVALHLREAFFTNRRFLTWQAYQRRLTIVSRPMPTPPARVTLSLVGGQDHRAASDGDVARGLMAGEVWATVETWHRFAPMVLTLAKRTLGSHSEAEDIAQEAFCQVYRKVGTLRDPDSLRSFIYACALRLLQTELRRKKLRSWLSFERPDSLDRRAVTTSDVESRNLLQRLYGLLERLGARDRMIFVLNRMESMSVEEIATAMEISESTVKRSLAHSLGRMRHWIEGGPHGFDQGRQGT